MQSMADTSRARAFLSQGAALYVGNDLNNMMVFVDGEYVGQESFERRYGTNPAIFNSIVKLGLTEPFVLAHPRITEYVFVNFHGITDSAFQGKDVGRRLFNAGHNFMSVLLPGHGSDSARINQIELIDWQNAVDRAIRKASTLGKKIVLIGLSTGAALTIDRAYRKPEGIHAIVPIAPAIGIANNFVNILESVGLFPLVARVVPQIGSENTEQTEVRQIQKGAHSIHVLHQLGKGIQAAVHNRKLFVDGYLITSGEDTAIEAKRVPELLASMPNGEWLNIVSSAGIAMSIMVKKNSRQSTLYTARAPVHSAMVFDPKYVAHQLYVESPEVQAEGKIIRPFGTLDEANPEFDRMMTEIEKRFPIPCADTIATGLAAG